MGGALRLKRARSPAPAPFRSPGSPWRGAPGRGGGVAFSWGAVLPRPASSGRSWFPPTRGRRERGAGLAGGWRPGRRGGGGLALAPSSSACGWRPQSSSVRALPAARVPFGLSSRLWSHGVRRDQPGGILLAQRRLRPPQGAARREPGDGGARRAVGRRRQGEGGGSAGAGRRHRVPLPGEAAGL